MTAGSSSAPLAGAPSDALRPRPFVSVLLPVHNELDELRECLAALARQTYPHDRFEVLVADGSDEPVDLAVVPSELDLAIVPNPAQVMTVGLNLVAKRARGDYVAIVSAHSSLPDEYLERIVETARSTGAANVGTRIRKVARSAWGRAIAAATSSPFGVGSSVQHHGSSAGPADSAFPGFIARSAFDALGGFNTALACNEDDEFNARLRAAGGGVWYEPAIEVVYRPRETLAGAFYQHFRYGRWKVAVARLGIPGYLRPRHAIPSLTVLGAMGLPLLGLYRRRLAPLTLVAAAAYGLLSAVEGYRMARRHDASAWRAAFVFPVVHAGYGLGFLRGLLDRGLPDEGRSRRRRLEAGSDPERRPAPEPRTSAAGSGGGGLAARRP